MNATISARILSHVESGKSLEAAIDTVLGAGQYEAIVSDVYDALRAKAAKPCYCSSLSKSVYADKDSPSPRCDFCAGLRA